MDLAISIVSYNTKDFLFKCLNSIYSAPVDTKFQVYVVDNNSLDGSQNMVESCFPDVHLIRNTGNDGFAKANNQVINNISSKYIFLLNPDIIVMEGSINRMISFMDKNPDIGILGCKLLNPDLSLQYSCRRYPHALNIFLRGLDVASWFFNTKTIRHYMMADCDHLAVTEVDWIMGSCMLLRRDAVQEIGSFDESFFMYVEDVDLCLRMWKSWKVCYFPHSQMIHHHFQQSRKFTSIRQKLIHIKSFYNFFKKHGPCPRRPAKHKSNKNPTPPSVAGSGIGPEGMNY